MIRQQAVLWQVRLIAPNESFPVVCTCLEMPIWKSLITIWLQQSVTSQESGFLINMLFVCLMSNEHSRFPLSSVGSYANGKLNWNKGSRRPHTHWWENWQFEVYWGRGGKRWKGVYFAAVSLLESKQSQILFFFSRGFNKSDVFTVK